MFLQHLSKKETPFTPAQKILTENPKKNNQQIERQRAKQSNKTYVRNKGVETLRTNCGTHTE